jgi:hypothetical protein
MMLASPEGSLPPPRWARGPLSVPYRLGTPTYKLQVKTKSGACNHALPHIPWHRIQPPNRGGVQSCHVSSVSETHLLAKVGSSTTTCPNAPDPMGGLQSATCPMAPGSHLRVGRASSCHVSYGPLWAVGLKHEEKPSRPACATWLACSQRTHTHFQGG